MSDWPGYDATAPEQREFPDLAPIRPRESRPRDGYGPGQQGQQPEPGDWPSGGGGYRSGGGGYPVGTPARPPAGPGRAGAADGTGPRWSPGQQAQADHAMGQREPGQTARSREPEEDIPDWAEPDSDEAFSARWHRRGLDSRKDRRSDRRKRRRGLIGGAGAAAAVIAVAVYFLIGGDSGSPSLGFGSLVTTFLPGELQQVPDACDTVPGSLLSAYLPGTRRQAAPPLNTGADTQCTWTLDRPPTYRVLEVQLVAYSPSALYGNGSATVVAEETYASSEQGFVKPGTKSGEPSAIVTQLSGMPGGSQTSAFSATQVFKVNGAVTDVAHVLVRYRNVVVSVSVNGLEQANGAKKYGPVAMSDLSTAAKTVAREVAGKIVG